MPMNRERYPENWEEISQRIRFERAGNRCEWCGIANGYKRPNGAIVVLTVHHKGVPKADGTPGDRHDKMDCRDENLVALCQSCHWTADWDIHKFNQLEARRQRLREAGQLELFVIDAVCPR